MGELKKYTLGSGHLHIAIYENGQLPTDWNAFFGSTDNILGRIKGGASFEYTTNKYEDEDDLGYIKIEEVTKEKVVLKSGMMTWDGGTLTKICTTARTSVAADGTVTTKIGGLANQNTDRWVLGFEHKDKNLRVIIVGKNNEGFTFDFKQDSATVIDCQFAAEANDDEGTLIIIQDLRNCPVLSSLDIGGLALTPAFSPFVKSYAAATGNAKDKITASAKTSTDTVTIKNKETAVNNGEEATWTSGKNNVTVEVARNETKFTYSIEVTKS